ncbi:hypothetical protein MAP00_003912 [Monascus purpureus]|nr:hypothetical protein MAP00_003912 [Monascus purpureus]
MFSGSPNGASVIPSRHGLRVLRSLALTGNSNSTVGRCYCTSAALTYAYHVQRRCLPRRVIETSRRAFHPSAPVHDATSAAQNLVQVFQPADKGDVYSSAASRNGDAKVETAERITRYPDTFKAMISEEKKLQALLDDNKPIEAAELFLAQHPSSLPRLATEKRHIAAQIFLVNCREENVFVAKSVFDRLDSVDQVSRSMWRMLIIALAKKGCIESVATLYLRFKDHFDVPPELLEIIIRSLIETRRLTTAKWLLYRSLQYDRWCGLIGVFLRGVWKRTRSMELLESQKEKILSLLPRFGKKPTEKLFNPVIEAYIEFGKVAEVSAVMEEMQTQHGLRISCRTRGLLAYSLALRCDWEGVKRELDDMHALKLTRDKKNFARAFDRLLLEYWVSHTGAEIHAFVMEAVDKYRLRPDKVLYKHILEAYIEKGNRDMVDEINRIARERSWGVEVSDEEFLDMLRARRLAVELSPVGAWKMLRATRMVYGQAATSRQILGYDQTSFPVASVNQMPVTGEALAWYHKTFQQRLPSRPVDQFQNLELQMAYFMHVGKLSVALKSFYDAKNAGKHLKQLHVELAVVATLLLNGLDAARAVIDDLWPTVQHEAQSFPIFFHQIKGVGPEDEQELMKLGIFQFYSLCRLNPRVQIKHHITIATSRRLILNNQPARALDLLVSVYKSRYGRIDKFNGTCMKMFVRAFAAQRDLHGVRWCLITSLARGTALNREMVVEARRVIMQLKLDSKDRGNAELIRKLAYLEHVADMVEKKSLGDRTIPSFRSVPGVKRYFRRTELNWHRTDSYQFDTKNLGKTVRQWDEEYELAIVLGEIQPSSESVSAMWPERNVLEEEDLAFFGIPAAGRRGTYDVQL